MNDIRLCCGTEMKRSEGRLEQSGQTHIPTTVWTCPKCNEQHWDASRRPWKTTELRDPLTHAVVSTTRSES